MSGIARLTNITLDCAEPKALAEFYAALLGWDRLTVQDDWVDLSSGSGVEMAFQRVADHRPATWPEPTRPQQFHLDLTIDRADLAGAEELVLSLGGTVAAEQPGGQWRVFVDPAGHPFCLCWNGTGTAPE